MNIQEILARVDHTLLAQDATWEQIKEIIDDGIKYQTASVCIPACFVGEAAEYAKGEVKICTVIGFPNGYSTTEAKVYEAWEAVHNGADEVDMVINIGDVKSGKYQIILNEINRIKLACGNKILKVIIETCLLTDEEIIEMCKVVSASKADFIKTSTGFSKGGATLKDVILMKEHCFNNTKIKAAGGISSIEDAESFIAAGADRLGTSRIVKIAKGNDNDKKAY